MKRPDFTVSRLLFVSGNQHGFPGLKITPCFEKGDYSMRLVRIGAFAAAALLASQQASAQTLHGIRAEADVGVDRFYSEGNHDSHLGWGGEIGADFDLGGFVLGPYGSFWMAKNENVTADGPGVAFRKSFEE